MLIPGNLAENISFYSDYDSKKIDELIELIDLSELKGKNLLTLDEKTDLSMGQKQLVNFASYFAEGKPIIILDEAFSNLDKKNLENLVSFLLDQQVTLLFILHNLDQELVAKFDFCLNFSENQIFLQPVTD